MICTDKLETYACILEQDKICILDKLNIPTIKTYTYHIAQKLDRDNFDNLVICIVKKFDEIKF